MDYVANFPYNQKRTIFVTGFGDGIDVKILTAVFLPFGEIVGVIIPMNCETGEHRGLGFVEYDCPEDAVAAIDNMHNSEMYGRTICVEYARPPKVTINPNRPAWADDEWLEKYGRDPIKEDVEI